MLPELKLEIVKRYTLAKVPADERDNPIYPAYHLQLEIELSNTGDAARSVAYRLDGPTGMPLEGWWFAHKISQRWFAARVCAMSSSDSPAAKNCKSIARRLSRAKSQPMGEGKALAYAGVDGQYFSAVLIPNIQSLDESGSTPRKQFWSVPSPTRARRRRLRT